jgi:hypothetical protein
VVARRRGDGNPGRAGGGDDGVSVCATPVIHDLPGCLSTGRCWRTSRPRSLTLGTWGPSSASPAPLPSWFPVCVRPGQPRNFALTSLALGLPLEPNVSFGSSLIGRR